MEVFVTFTQTVDAIMEVDDDTLEAVAAKIDAYMRDHNIDGILVQQKNKIIIELLDVNE